MAVLLVAWLKASDAETMIARTFNGRETGVILWPLSGMWSKRRSLRAPCRLRHFGGAILIGVDVDLAAAA